ncbi:hypothetical protein ALI22I_03095 [Saccharothrix sp. ALI-22-I]|uniref:hypothetical protein n=1 Tax=Saccharothrix sp. ALI-22-I TaxID=1933778 RepID=UPI00097C714C|nr:hypothetical protein [Saccharothrix sp. ALI-22-I]ONI92589.1 hypothetical protein ALI22I_03095 [Saccharothrix sp. ALI-22-I]
MSALGELQRLAGSADNAPRVRADKATSVVLPLRFVTAGFVHIGQRHGGNVGSHEHFCGHVALLVNPPARPEPLRRFSA